MIAKQLPPKAGVVISVVIVLAAVGLRLFLALSAPESFDMKSWQSIAKMLETSHRIYEDTDRYNFPPVWSWLLAGFHSIARRGIDFSSVVRLFLTIVDLCSAGLLFELARGEGSAVSPWNAAALFLANPVSIWVSAIQGQFDGFSMLFLLAAVLLSVRGNRGAASRSIGTGLLLFASLSAKQVSALHPILWLRRPKGFVSAALAYGLTAALFLPYASQWRAIRDRVLLYRSVPRSYGFSEFVLYDSRAGVIVSAMALAAGVVAAGILGNRRLPRACLLLFLVLLFFAPGLGSQYLIWPLTFGALYAGPRYFLFTGFSMLWILGSHFGVPGSGRWMGHLLWLSVALWGIAEARSLGLFPKAEPANGFTSDS